MVKKLFAYANEYADKCDWKDFALLKGCLIALGIMLGMNVSKKNRKPVLIMSAIIFTATYIPVMTKFLGIITEGEKKCLKNK